MADHEADGRVGLTMASLAEAAPDLADGHRLFSQDCQFLLGVAELAQLPPASLPEVAFAGRSNVGKSSLINALTGRRQLARTSNTPGRTQQINLFDLAGRMILVDLPGYGFAKAPKPEVERWQARMRDYLRGRPTLRLACILIDARHGPKPIDEAMLTMLGEAAVAFRLILTKADLVKPAVLEALSDRLQTALLRKSGAYPDLSVTSARTDAGMDELKAMLATFALPAAPPAASSAD